MDFHGFSRIFMVFHGFSSFLRIFDGFKGLTAVIATNQLQMGWPSRPLGCSRARRACKKRCFRAIWHAPCSFFLRAQPPANLKNHGFSWIFKDFHGFSLFLRVFDGFKGFTAVIAMNQALMCRPYRRLGCSRARRAFKK